MKKNTIYTPYTPSHILDISFDFLFILFGSNIIKTTTTILVLNRGQDIESQEMLRQGFTHAFLMTFNKKEDFTAFASHPNHVEFSATFSAAIEKIVLLDFPAVLAKAPK